MSMRSNDTDKCYNIDAAAIFCLDTFLNYEDSSLPFCLQICMYEAHSSNRLQGNNYFMWSNYTDTINALTVEKLDPKGFSPF
jgi:hypothetical protein